VNPRWRRLRGVRAAFFDLGGTVLSVDHARVARVLAELGHAPRDGWVAPAERAGRRECDRQQRAGAPPETAWRSYFEAMLRSAGAPPETVEPAFQKLAEFHRRHNLWTRVVPGVREALTALARAGYRVAAISNSDGRAEWLLGTVGLAREFEFVVDSHEVGFEKPDPRIFHLGCERLGLAPDRCAYLGDLLTVDVEGSAAAGLRPVLVDHFGSYDADEIPADVPRAVEASEIVAGFRAAEAEENDPVDGREEAR